jgi:hypothetical protein
MARGFSVQLLSASGHERHPLLGLTGYDDQCLQVVKTEREVQPRTNGPERDTQRE